MLKRILQSWFPKNNLDAIVPAAVGFAIIFIYTRHSGIGISPDSVMYVSAARNVHQHGALMDFDNRPLVMFPAFYPLFLSSLIFVSGTDPLIFGALLNSFLFFLVVYVCGWMLEKFPLRSKWYKHIILSCIVLSPCLLEVYSMLWSETLFILLLLFFFIALRKYFQTLSVSSLLIAAAVAALACITRYAGVTLIGAGCLLLLFDPQIRIKKKLFHIMVFGIGSSSLLIMNLIRNNMVSTTLTGLRESSLTSVNDNIFYIGDVLCDWLPLPNGNYPLTYCIALLVIMGCAATLFYYVMKKNEFSSLENILTAYFLVYALFIIITATLSRYEQITSRLLSPSFIPFTIGCSYWFLMFITKFTGKWRIIITVIAIIVALGFQTNQYLADYENYDGIKDAGIPGYTEDPWNKDSEVANFLKNNYKRFLPNYTIYSNGDDGVYFFTGLRCDILPHRENAKEIQDFYQKRYCYLVWMDESENPELITLQEVLAHKKMICLRQFGNGGIYITDEIPANTRPW